jgi:parallel beta-helix repeat protein
MFSVRRPVCSLTLLIALAGAAGLPARAAAVPPNPNLECGDTVTASARLTKDLTACPGDGLVIGAPNVVLDLAGHTISSNPQSEFVAGVRVAGQANVTVRGGRIEGFNSNVLLTEAPGAEVDRMTLVGAQFAGVATGAQNGATVQRSVFDNNVIAIVTDQSSNIRLDRNVVHEGAFGISLGNGSDFSLTRNLLVDQEFRGILVASGAMGASLDRNVVLGSGQDGIVVNDATATLTRNQADGNAANGIAAVDGVAGSRNSASNNGGVNCAPAYLCSK